MSQIGVAHIPGKTRIRDLGQIDQLRGALNSVTTLSIRTTALRRSRWSWVATLLALRSVIARLLRVEAIDIWSSRLMQARATLLTLIHQRTRQSH